MAKFFIYSSHGFHLLYAPNFLAQVLSNLDVALPDLFTKRLSVFLEERISIQLQSFEMTLSLYIVLLLVLLITSLAGGLVSIAWHLWDIRSTKWILFDILSSIYWLGPHSTLSGNLYFTVLVQRVLQNNFPLSNQSSSVL